MGTPGGCTSGAVRARLRADSSRIGPRVAARQAEALVRPNRRGAGGARHQAPGGPAPPAEAEAADDVGDDAGLDSRLRAALGISVRRRVRPAAVPARDRAR